MTYFRGGVAALLLTLIVFVASRTTTQAGALLPDPAVDDQLAAGKVQNTLVLAGGCFWGMEEVFQHVRGVTKVVSGYSGGSARNATYELVSTGTTGHAESVQITYDPAKTSFGQLLKVFFSVAHDPTQVNAQRPDTGPQYRSVIFFSGERQQQVAKAYIDQLTAARAFSKPIATQLVPLTAFYPAEDYHQDYAIKHPQDRYIVFVDLPKVEELRRQLPALYVK
jgi:peptide-methionine (S)-S-oxide reductase